MTGALHQSRDFLKFPLKTTEDVVESKVALATRARVAAHTAHANEPLGLHCGATPAANDWPLTIDVERVTRTQRSCFDGDLRGHNRVDSERVVAVSLGRQFECPVR